MKLAYAFGGPKLTAARLKALESQLGCRLPDAYRKFLLRHNGGVPSKPVFRATKREADPDWVDFFHHADEFLATPNKKAHPFSLASIHYAAGGLIPDDCLIIGMASRDNLLL